LIPYPSGPEHPDWDEAVRRTKKIVHERQKREVSQALQQTKDLKKEQERQLKQLRAGRDIVLRGSQLGLAIRKPLEEMTSEEFETVGALATTPGKETSTGKKSRALGSLFTKVLGGPKAREEYAEEVRRKLDRHKSLDLLELGLAADSGELKEEYRAHYEEALAFLGRERLTDCNSLSPVSPMSPASASSSLYSISPDGEVSDTNNDTLPFGGSKGTIGLGIATTPSRPARENRKYNNFQEFAAMWRRRESGDDEDAEDSAVLSDISEEDGELHIGAASSPSHSSTVTAILDPTEREHEDGNSWCTESFESGDDEAGQVHESTSDAATLGSEHNNVDTESTESDDRIEVDAIPAPLQLRVLRVKESSEHMPPTVSNSFIPDRKASFHARIQEASRLQQAHIGGLSHPALRATDGNAENGWAANMAANNAFYGKDDVEADLRRASIDSGYAEMADERYGDTASSSSIPGSPDAREHPSKGSFETVTGCQQRSNTLQGQAVRNESSVAGDMDLTALRSEVGLGPLRFASSISLRHPHHPYTWTHEKVMCRSIHTTAATESPATRSIAARPSSSFSSRTTAASSSLETRMCPHCGTHCCRYINLIVMSAIKPSGDIMEEMVRMRAQQRLEMLKASYPDGVEEYETFLRCECGCGEMVCPECAGICGDKGCEKVVCKGCLGGREMCSLH